MQLDGQNLGGFPHNSDTVTQTYHTAPSMSPRDPSLTVSYQKSAQKPARLRKSRATGRPVGRPPKNHKLTTLDLKSPTDPIVLLDQGDTTKE